MAKASQSYIKTTSKTTNISFSLSKALQNLGLSQASSFAGTPVNGNPNVVNCPVCGKFMSNRGGGRK